MIKPGMKFKNSFMELTVLCYDEISDKNLALLFSTNDEMFITVRNLSKYKDEYAWCWGHYFIDIRDAVKDYDERKKDL